jgi:3-hydroxybutyrate dehydrogenase
MPDKRTALVTGSVAGIGLAIARALAGAGHDLVLNGFAPDVDPEEVRAGLESEFGIAAVYHPANLERTAEIAELVEGAATRFGGVDILVNNAAAPRQRAAIEELPIEQWEQALAVNLSAPFHLIRALLPGMRRRDWGRIVNIASGFGLIASKDRAGYITTKHGLIGLTKAAAAETAHTGITCNAVCPGATLTHRQSAFIAEIAAREGLSTAEAEAIHLRNLPAERFLSPDGMAAAVMYLCGDGARDVTGIALPVDGGQVAMLQ